METFQLHAGVVIGELPVDGCGDAVLGSLPSGDLAAQDIDLVDAPVQALADEDIEFDLGDVQPTAVLGGVDELEAVP